MKLYHIVAVARGRVIGKNGKLPWHFSADLKYFKKTTMGSTLIMGRKTFESIGQKPLPGRENFVLSRQPGTGPSQDLSLSVSEHLRFFDSFEKALAEVKTEKAFIIGGGELFGETMNKIDGIFLTRIHADFEGDTFYPAIPHNFKEGKAEILQEDPKVEAFYLEKQK